MRKRPTRLHKAQTQLPISRTHSTYLLTTVATACHLPPIQPTNTCFLGSKRKHLTVQGSHFPVVQTSFLEDLSEETAQACRHPACAGWGRCTRQPVGGVPTGQLHPPVVMHKGVPKAKRGTSVIPSFQPYPNTVLVYSNRLQSTGGSIHQFHRQQHIKRTPFKSLEEISSGPSQAGAGSHGKHHLWH